MARRRSKQKRRASRRKQPIKLLNVAEGFILANAATKAAFDTNVIPFLTEGWLLPTSSATNNSYEISASEIFKTLTGIGSVTDYGVHSSHALSGQGLGAIVRSNFERNGAKALITMVATPFLFRMGKQLASKPINMVNRGLKQLGVAKSVKV